MNRALLKKNIREAIWLLIACALYAFGFSMIRVFVVSEFDTNRFRTLLELIPDTFKSFTPVDFEWLISYSGRIAFNLDEPMLLLCVALWAIARGSDIVSGELSRGTMEMLLSQPISRRAVFLTQSAVTLSGMLLIVLATWFGMWLGVQISTVQETAVRTPLQTLLEPALLQMRDGLRFLFDALGLERLLDEKKQIVLMREQVACLDFWPGLLNMFAFGFFVTGLAVLFSAADRHRWRTIGLVTGIYSVMAMIKFVGMSIKHAGGCLWFTFFTFYEPEDAIAIYQKDSAALWSFLKRNSHGEVIALGPMANNLFLLLGACVFFYWGLRIFSRRDLPAPL